MAGDVGTVDAPSTVDGRAARLLARAQADVLAADAAARRAVADRRAALDLERQRAEFVRHQRAARRAELRQRAAERRQRRQAVRASVVARARVLVPAVTRRALVVLPIGMAMSVAWIGQIGFARAVLGWPLPGAVAFAGGFESSALLAGWLFIHAHRAGDRAAAPRAATIVLAGLAATMNYWHTAPDWSPTPAAVSYASMSLVGIGLWELYAGQRHRAALRAAGRLAPPRPRFGLAHWVRYPRTAWTAWSLTIRDGLTTTEAAWAAAVAERSGGDGVPVGGGRPADEPQGPVAAPTDIRSAAGRRSGRQKRADRKSGRPRVDDGPLMPAARKADADHRAQHGGAPISRDALAAALGIGSGRAGRIRAALLAHDQSGEVSP